MSDSLLVATRKGLFAVERGAKNWRVTRAAFLGDSLSAVFKDPRDQTLYAALALSHFGAKLHRSRDNGTSWQECAAPAYPEREAPDPESDQKSGPSLVLIWTLEAADPAKQGTLWAGTIPGGLFYSEDAGDSWELVDSLWERPERKEWFGGGFDQPGIHSICVDPRHANHVTVGVSCGGVWVTRDGGASWKCRARGMRADYMPPQSQKDCWIQDPHRLVQCEAHPDTMWTQHHNGIFKTGDGAESWVEIENVEPSSFGFAVAVHPRHPGTAWFVPAVKDERRIPVGGRMVVTRTEDGGQTFQILRDGLPQEHAYDIVFRHGLEVDVSGEWLAMGSSTGSLWISEDGGESWRAISHHLPPIYCVRFLP